MNTQEQSAVSMRIAFLPVNRAWCVLFGLSFVSLDGQTIFNDRRELLDALGRKGLRVTKNNVVEVTQ